MVFSIVIPTYNVDKYLGLCLDSIINQSYKDYEVLIVDDSSSDKSYDIALEYSYKYSNIKCYQINHVPVGTVRNIAIQNASGNYIVFIDGDDSIKPGMLEELHKALSGNNPDICFLPNHWIDNNELSLHMFIPSVHENHYFDSDKNFIGFMVDRNGRMPGAMWSIAVKLELIKNNNLSINPCYSWSEDTDFIYQCLSCSKDIAICAYPGYIWNRKNIKSSSSNISVDRAISRLEVYRKWYCSVKEGLFDKISTDERDVLCRNILSNYCEVLNIYTFCFNRRIRKRIARKIIDDSIWNLDKSLIPKEYYKYGIIYGRILYLFNHSVRKIIALKKQ